MIEREFDGEYFSPASTLGCGQVFRYREGKEGYLVAAGSRACRLFSRDGRTVIRCAEGDEEYFYRYFDLGRDYETVYKRASGCGIPFVAAAASPGKGIRILNQEAEETIFSFLLSQNNHIPRIRMLLLRICERFGEERALDGEKYRTFPRAERLAEEGEEFYRKLGCGYRAKYIAETARILAKENAAEYGSLTTEKLRAKLETLPGVGPKVADCIALFAYHRTESFPVDTWIERVYREELGGQLTNRSKIAAYFAGLFGEAGGYIQQYLFWYERERRKGWQK